MSQSITTADDTYTTASSSNAMTLADLNLNAVNICKAIMGYSLIPTDICMVRLNDTILLTSLTLMSTPLFMTLTINLLWTTKICLALLPILMIGLMMTSMMVVH